MTDDITNPEWIAKAKDAIARLEFIRDCFLNGRDAEGARAFLEIGDDRPAFMAVGGLAYRNRAIAFSCTPQIPFRPLRFATLAMEDDVDLHVIAMQVGRTPIFINTDPVNARFFSTSRRQFVGPDAFDAATPGDLMPLRHDAFAGIGLPITAPICHVGQDFTVTVELRECEYGSVNFSGIVLGVLRETDFQYARFPLPRGAARPTDE